MKIGYVVDSASDISYDFADANNIAIAPMMAHYHGEDHFETRDFDLDVYYENFEKEKTFLVKTSQPSPQGFLDAFEKLIADGCTHIITVTVSSGLSGSFNGANAIASHIEEEGKAKTHVIDSKTASYGVMYLIELGMQMVKDGETDFEKIVNAMEERKAKVSTILYLPTLKYLRAGGRISMPKYLIGSLLGKPISKMNLETGANDVVATAFTRNKGLHKVYNLTTDNGKNLAKRYHISHTHDQALADELTQIIHNVQPEVEISYAVVRSSISAHTGPGSLALYGLFDE